MNNEKAATLWEGAAFYVAVKAYNSIESSNYSNIEYFSLSDSHINFTSGQGSFNGLTLITPMTSTTTYLIDDYGQIKHQWESSYTPGLSVYLLADGSLLRTGKDDLWTEVIIEVEKNGTNDGNIV